MKKLTPGMHIRVVSPSASIEHIGGFEANLAAKKRLEKLGFTVSFSEHYLENDMLDSASIESRVADIHAAFSDDSVDAILATIGGFNCNALLPYLDFDLIARNPKTESWLKAVSQTSYELTPSEKWGDNAWYLPDAPLTFHETEWKVYHHGQAQATVIGGNLSTFSLLRGTPYAPTDENYVLFVEEAEEDDYVEFDRNLAALLQAYPNPQALLIGRFPKECQMTEELLLYILDKHPILKTIPVLYDLDFAHTQPLFTITIGAQATVDTETMSIRIDE